MDRIFISHSRLDDAEALAVFNWLGTQGVRDCFLDLHHDRGMVPGDAWSERLTAAEDVCQAVICLVSEAWLDSKECKKEYEITHNAGKQVFPVLIKGMSVTDLPKRMRDRWHACDLAAKTRTTKAVTTIEVDHPPRVPKTRVKFSSTGLDALAKGLRKVGLLRSSQTWPPGGDPKRAPYPGSRPFDESEAAVFFGREVELDTAISKLQQLIDRSSGEAFVIHGASGVGKSSFLRAGLLPRLRDDPEHFMVLPLICAGRTPISGPHGLLKCLVGALREAGSSPPSDTEVSEALTNGDVSDLLDRIARRRQIAAPSKEGLAPMFVLPIDEADALFDDPDKGEAKQFLDLLGAHRQKLRASRNALPPPEGEHADLVVLLTMRSEYLQRVRAEVGALPYSAEFFRLEPVAPTELKTVIEGPAQKQSQTVHRVHVPPALSKRLQDDIEGDGNSIPMLAVTLRTLFESTSKVEAVDRRTELDLAAYEKSNGFSGVVVKFAEAALDGAIAAKPAAPTARSHEALIHQLLPHLVTVEWTSLRARRKQVPRSELSTLDQACTMAVANLVEHRILASDIRFSAHSSGSPVGVVQVSSDAVLRHWPAAQAWLEKSIRRRRSQRLVLCVCAAGMVIAAGALARNAWLGHQTEKETQARMAQVRQALASKEYQRGLRFAVLTYRSLLRRGAPVPPDLWPALSAMADASGGSRELLGHSDQVTHAEFSRDGSRVVTASNDKTTRLWSVETGEPIGPPLQHDGQVVYAGFGADGNQVVTLATPSHRGDKAATLHEWNVATGTSRRTLWPDSGVLKACIFPMGDRLVAVTPMGDIRFWNLRDWAKEGASPGAKEHPDAKIHIATFSLDCRLLATVASNTEVSIWSTHGAPRLGPFLHRNIVTAASFSHDGSRLLTVEDLALNIWDTMKGQFIKAQPRQGDWIKAAALNEDGRHVARATEREIGWWDSDRGTMVSSAKVLLKSIVAMDWSPDQKWLVLRHAGGEVLLQEASAGASKLFGKPINLRDRTIDQVRLTPDGTKVVTTNREGRTQVWDPLSGRPVEAASAAPKVESPTRSFKTRVARKASSASSADASCEVLVTDGSSGQAIGKPIVCEGESPKYSLSENGQRLALAYPNDTVKVWSVDSGLAVGEPLRHRTPIAVLELSHDGEKLLTASSDQTVRIWHVASGVPIGADVQHRRPVSKLSIGSDGKQFVSLGGTNKERVAQVWREDWSSQPTLASLVEAVCMQRLKGKKRVLGSDDLLAAKGAFEGHLRVDVCSTDP